MVLKFRLNVGVQNYEQLARYIRICIIYVYVYVCICIKVNSHSIWLTHLFV